ncbi:MAG: hypothetical protein AB6733_22540 [Clostridiaceae bacterium]
MKINFKEKRVLIPLIVISIFLIGALVFWIAYSSYINPSTSKYINTIEKASTDIHKANDDLKIITSVDPIDSELAKEKIPVSIDSLTKTRSEISSLEPIVKYEESTKNLLVALDNNINFYKQVVVILESPKAKDLDVSLENLEKYKTAIIYNYKMVSIQNIDFQTSTSANAVFENLIEYTKTLIDKNTQLQNNKTLTNKYIAAIEDIAASFYNVKTNLSVNLSDARSDKDYDYLINIINTKASTLASIKKTLSTIEVPESGETLYDNIYNSLEYYNDYLSNFKTALESEKEAVYSGKKDYDQLDELYQDSKVDYRKVSDSITEFDDNLTLLKKGLE